MNWNRIEANAKQFTAKLKAKFGLLTEDETTAKRGDKKNGDKPLHRSDL